MKKNGMILISVLMFLTLMSGIVIHAAQSNLLSYKMIQASTWMTQLFIAADSTLLLAENEVKKFCLDIIPLEYEKECNTYPCLIAQKTSQYFPKIIEQRSRDPQNREIISKALTPQISTHYSLEYVMILIDKNSPENSDNMGNELFNVAIFYRITALARLNGSENNLYIILQSTFVNRGKLSRIFIETHDIFKETRYFF